MSSVRSAATTVSMRSEEKQKGESATRTGRIRNARGSCCRCFLPDLTGFTGLRRAGPSPGDTWFPRDTPIGGKLLEGVFGPPALSPLSRQQSVSSRQLTDYCQLPTSTISGEERRIIRACSPYPCGAVLALLRRSNRLRRFVEPTRLLIPLSTQSSAVSLQSPAY